MLLWPPLLAGAEPRVEQTTDTTFFDFDVGLPGFGFGFVDLPYFDNSRGTLRGSTYDVEIFATPSGTYINSEFQTEGTTFGIIDWRMGFQLDGVGLQVGRDIPVRCVGRDCPRFTTFSELPQGPVQARARRIGPLDQDQIGGAGAGVVDLRSRWTALTPWSFEGNMNLSGSITGTFDYDAKTSLEYALDALMTARSDVRLDPDLRLSRQAYAAAINLRTRDKALSSTNKNIRDVEYFLRGYSGAEILREGALGDLEDANDYFNLIVPISAPGYEVLKFYLGNDFLSPDNAPPASQIGGTPSALAGWFNAFFNARDLEQAIYDEFGESAAPEGAPAGAAGRQATVEIAGGRGGGERGLVFLEQVVDVLGPSPFILDGRETRAVIWAAEDIVAGTPYFLPREMDDFTTFAAFGGQLTGLEVNYDGVGGPLDLRLIWEGGELDFLSNIWLDLTVLAPGGLEAGAIEILSDFYDPKRFALYAAFAEGGRGALGTLSFSGDPSATSTSAVPVPAAGGLLALAMGGLGLHAARRRRVAAGFRAGGLAPGLADC